MSQNCMRIFLTDTENMQGLLTHLVDDYKRTLTLFIRKLFNKFPEKDLAKSECWSKHVYIYIAYSGL